MATKETGRINPIQVQKYLKGVHYPLSKQDLLNTAKSHGADANVMNQLKNLPDKSYEAPTAVTRELGKLK